MEELGALAEHIETLVEAAAETTMMQPLHEPGGYYYLKQPGKDAELVLANPPWHREVIESPVEMEKFIKERMGDFKKPVIFYGDKSIVLVYDFNTRRDVAKCDLVPSSQWNALVKLTGVSRTQKDFIRDLRVVYRSCLADTNLIANLRGIKWDNRDGGDSNLQHGKESMGRQIINQVQGVDVIPEEISLTIPVFENHTFRTRIQCAVDVNPESRTFALTPFPQELHNAMEAALDDILLGLTKTDFPPAFRGSVFNANS